MVYLGHLLFFFLEKIMTFISITNALSVSHFFITFKVGGAMDRKRIIVTSIYCKITMPAFHADDLKGVTTTN